MFRKEIKTHEEFEKDYQRLRRQVLNQICVARLHYFRLEKELAELQNTLPDKCYIAMYVSNSGRRLKSQDDGRGEPKYKYYALGCKDKLLPTRAKTEPSQTKRRPNEIKRIKAVDLSDERILTNKIHLGHVYNPNYLTAVIELERSRARKIKQEAYENLKVIIRETRSYWLESKRFHQRFSAKPKNKSSELALIDKEIMSSKDAFSEFNGFQSSL